MSEQTPAEPLTVHWPNPWSDAVPVPVEELAAVVASHKGWSVEQVVGAWKTFSDKLDAYVLPRRNSYGYSAGIRYGTAGAEYLSPDFIGYDVEIEQLLTKYTPLKNS